MHLSVCFLNSIKWVFVLGKTFELFYNEIENKVSEYMIQEMKINNYNSDIHKERMKIWTIYLRKEKIKKLRNG